MPNDSIALLRDAKAERCFAHYKGTCIDTATFLRDVQRVITQLIPRKYVLNTSDNRYHFLVSFAAALSVGQTTLLPPSGARDAIERLLSQYPDSYWLSDTLVEGHPYPDVLLDVSGFTHTGDNLKALNPTIKCSQTVAILFTSGSTGEPKAQCMSWFKLVNSARQLNQLLKGRGVRTNPIIATVPAQHMFGFETSVLLPLQSSRPLWTGASFYPADVQAAQQSINDACLLVTTPLHLRALVKTSIEYSKAAMILSATAPLTVDLASIGEQRFACNILEIYGSSETGAIATRQTTRDTRWQTMAGVDLKPVAGGVWVNAPGLSAPVHLSDYINQESEGYFTLQGRAHDLIKIAGKRQSLSYLNNIVQSIDGVEDAVVFLPPEKQNDTDPYLTRLAAIVVAQGKTPNEIVRQMRHLIDPVFIPRPVYKVTRLPRSPSGKLPISALTQLWRELQHNTDAT